MFSTVVAKHALYVQENFILWMDQLLSLVLMVPGTGKFARRCEMLKYPSNLGCWHGPSLSGPHQESPHHDLSPNMEVLLGTVRFQV